MGAAVVAAAVVVAPALASEGRGRMPADLARAASFVESRGGPLELARLHYLLTREAPPAEAVAALLAGQRADGGWADPWAAASTVDATCYRLAQADQLGLGAAEPAVARAVRFLAQRQQPDGHWQEDAALAGVVPPWATPGDERATLYLTANAGLWLAVLEGAQGGAARAAEYLLSSLGDDGRLPSFLHAHWLAAGLLWRLGRRAPAERICGHLQCRLGELAPSNLAWLLTSLTLGGVAASHPLVTAAAARLEATQNADGRWPSEDGPAWDLHSTLEALYALAACGRLGGGTDCATYGV